MPKSKIDENKKNQTLKQDISRDALIQAQASMGLTALEPRILLDAAAVATGVDVITEHMTQEQTDIVLTALMEDIETSESFQNFDIATEDFTLTDADIKALSPVSDSLNTIKSSAPQSGDVKETIQDDGLHTIKLSSPDSSQSASDLVLVAPAQEQDGLTLDDNLATLTSESTQTPFLAIDDGNFEIHSGQTINIDVRANDVGEGELVGIIDPTAPNDVITLIANEGVQLASGLGVELLEDGTFNVTGPSNPTERFVSFDYVVANDDGSQSQATATFDWPVAPEIDLDVADTSTTNTDVVFDGSSTTPVFLAQSDATGIDPDGQEVVSLTLTLADFDSNSTEQIIIDPNGINSVITIQNASFPGGFNFNGVNYTTTVNLSGGAGTIEIVRQDGLTIPTADLNALIRAVAYTNNSGAPSAARTVDFTLNDGTFVSNVATATIVGDPADILLDTDGDGVLDVNDIDDDNDGILDINEGLPDFPSTAFDPNTQTQSDFSDNIQFIEFDAAGVASLTNIGDSFVQVVTLPDGSTTNLTVTLNALDAGDSLEAIPVSDTRPANILFGQGATSELRAIRNTDTGGGLNTFALTFSFDRALDLFVTDGEGTSGFVSNTSATTDGSNFEIIDAINPNNIAISGVGSQTVTWTANSTDTANLGAFAFFTLDAQTIDVTVNAASADLQGISIGIFQDRDGDGQHDYQDLDSDNDGISDLVESGNAAAIALDIDGNGTVSLNEGGSALTADSDGDGLLDIFDQDNSCLLYTSPSPRDLSTSRMPSSA